MEDAWAHPFFCWNAHWKMIAMTGADMNCRNRKKREGKPDFQGYIQTGGSFLCDVQDV